MKKMMNAVESILTESLDGFAAAHADLVKVAHDPTFVARARSPVHDKVALISGGGSGHEPLHAGFVGYGMLDAACPGQVFTSPTPDQMIASAAAVMAAKRSCPRHLPGRPSPRTSALCCLRVAVPTRRGEVGVHDAGDRRGVRRVDRRGGRGEQRRRHARAGR